jgi:phosphoglucosamine mutase
VRTQVGDRYVVEAMRQGGFVFGGEKSGHIVYLEHATTGDGLLAALKLLGVMRRERTKLSELSRIMTLYPQSLVNVVVKDKKPFEEVDPVRRAIEAWESKLGKSGRVMVRYSGTEAKARVLVEGPDAAQVAACAKESAGEIQRALG